MKLIMENWKKFVNEAEMRIYGTQKDWTPPEDDPEAKDPGAWRGFRDNEYLEMESESGLFFIHSEQKRLRSGEFKFNKKGNPQRVSGRSFITHKPSGKQVSSEVILMHPDFSGKSKLTFADLKKYMIKLDKWAMENIPDIASETLSRESEAKLAAFVAGEAGVKAYQSSNSNSMMENWKKFINEEIDDEQLKQLGLDKVPEVANLLKNLDGEDNFLKIAKSLKDAGIKPEELGDKLQQIEDFQTKFEDYLKSEEGKEEEKDREAERASREGSRAATDDQNSAKAQSDQL